jgi:hypothetical protein
MQASAIVADRNKVTAKMLRSGDLPKASRIISWACYQGLLPVMQCGGQIILSHCAGVGKSFLEESQ